MALCLIQFKDNMGKMNTRKSNYCDMQMRDAWYVRSTYAYYLLNAVVRMTCNIMRL